MPSTPFDNKTLRNDQAGSLFMLYRVLLKGGRAAPSAPRIGPASNCPTLRGGEWTGRSFSSALSVLPAGRGSHPGKSRVARCSAIAVVADTSGAWAEVGETRSSSGKNESTAVVPASGRLINAAQERNQQGGKHAGP